MTFIISLIIILHGLVHLLYFGQSRRYFELQSGMSWPDDSWLFSRHLSGTSLRSLAGIACILSTTGFLTGAIALLFSQTWWYDMVLLAAVWSILIFILFWDGKWRKLADNGAIGILINLAIIYTAMVYP